MCCSAEFIKFQTDRQKEPLLEVLPELKTVDTMLLSSPVIQRSFVWASKRGKCCGSGTNKSQNYTVWRGSPEKLAQGSDPECCISMCPSNQAPKLLL